MPSHYQESRFWAVAALVLWFGFFGVALFPDHVYEYLRAQGAVSTPHALINSVYVLFLMQIGYFFAFLLRSSHAAGLSRAMAQVLSIQLSLLALLAFLPVHLEDLPDFIRSGNAGMRRLLLSVCAFKVGAWFYLLTLLMRYYLFSGPEVFRQMVPVFPSAHQDDDAGK